jgi:hypothetical protein
LNEQPTTTTTQQDAESPTPREDLWNGTERTCANTTPSTPTPNTTGLGTVPGTVGGNRPPHEDFFGTQPSLWSADLP